MTRTITAFGAAIASIALLAACDDTTVNSTEVRQVQSFESQFFDQQDRKGRPAVNTLFIHMNGDPTVPSSTDTSKNRFNDDTPIEDDATWTATIQTSIEAFRGVAGLPSDGSDGNFSAAFLADLLTPDILQLDLSAGNDTAGFLGVELGVANSSGGRALSDDVVDVALSAVVFPDGPAAFTSDGVDTNDVPFLSTFPYLAPPN